MVALKFISHDGTETVVDAAVGLSVMEVGRNAGIPNIDADCGGACSCATCQVFVGVDWFEKLDPSSPEEEAMLEFANERRPTSRLSCQLAMRDDLDGLTVEVPASQF